MIVLMHGLILGYRIQEKHKNQLYFLTLRENKLTVNLSKLFHLTIALNIKFIEI